MIFRFGGDQSVFDPHGPIARSIATHGWWLLLMSIAVYLVVMVALLIALGRRRREIDDQPETTRHLTRNVSIAVALQQNEQWAAAADMYRSILEVAPDHAAFRCLLRLVDTGRCWIKLSAPYETSKTGAPKYEDVGRLAKALVKHAPERMVWASNWPHPSARKPAPPKDRPLTGGLKR